jgi:hypothetical protein
MIDRGLPLNMANPPLARPSLTIGELKTPQSRHNTAVIIG